MGLHVSLQGTLSLRGIKLRLFSLVLFTIFSIFTLTGCNEKNSQSNSWALDQDYSSFSITSIKKGSVAEAFHFKTIKGNIKPDGTAKIAINLATIESGIPVRDDRLKKILFEIVLFPTADIKAKLDLKDFTALNIGHRAQKKITFTLSLHGVEEEMEADVFVTRVSADAYSVATLKPLMVSAKTFKLSPALKKLAKLAKLPTIDGVAPTSFNLLFRRK